MVSDSTRAEYEARRLKTHIESRVLEAQTRWIMNNSTNAPQNLDRVGTRALMPNAEEGSRSVELETDIMQRYFRVYAQVIVEFSQAHLEAIMGQILQVWKLDVGAYDQFRNTYKKVEELFNTNPLSWPSKQLRKSVLSRLVRFALDRVLNWYDHRIVAWMAPKLKIERQVATEKLLPPWLNHDLFVIENSRVMKEGGNEISRPGDPQPLIGSHPVKPGHSISQEDVDGIHGTLGIVMEARSLDTLSSATNTTYVALTCAHVSSIATTAYAKDSRRSPPMQLMETSDLHIHPSARSFQRECVFLRIEEQYMSQFSLGFYEYMHRGKLDRDSLKNVEIDCHYYNPDISQGFAFDPTSISRRDFIEQAMLEGPVIVYKQGAKTGYTQGILIAIQDDLAPHCKYKEVMGHPLEPIDRHHDEWIGLVKWDSHSKPFAKRGDSGSLVFAGSGRALIPLGIHIASSLVENETSVFVSLDTFCLQARKREQIALSFPNRNIPWWVKLLMLIRQKSDRGAPHVAQKRSQPLKWVVRTRQWSMFESVISDASTECTSEDPYGRTLLSYLEEMNDHKLTDQLIEKIRNCEAS